MNAAENGRSREADAMVLTLSPVGVLAVDVTLLLEQSAVREQVYIVYWISDAGAKNHMRMR